MYLPFGQILVHLVQAMASIVPAERIIVVFAILRWYLTKQVWRGRTTMPPPIQM